MFILASKEKHRLLQENFKFANNLNFVWARNFDQ